MGGNSNWKSSGFLRDGEEKVMLRSYIYGQCFFEGKYFAGAVNGSNPWLQLRTKPVLRRDNCLQWKWYNANKSSNNMNVYVHGVVFGSNDENFRGVNTVEDPYHFKIKHSFLG